LSYIGKTPTVGNFIKLDAITTSATNSYTLQHNSVNFSPESANHMMVSLNGVIQAPNTSYSVSGSTITFLPSSGTLSSSDSIDFILIMGNILDVGVATTVTDSAITKGKLNLISDSSSAGLTVKGDGSSENGTIQLNCSQNSHGVKISSPAHSSGQSYELILPTGNVTADKVLKVASVSGSGTTGIGQLSFGDAGGVNTPSFSARLSSSLTLNDVTATNIIFQTEFFDVGSCYNNSTGVFTVPSGEDGKYCISTTCEFSDPNGNVSDLHLLMVSTIGGSTNSDQIARAESTSNGTTFTRASLSYTTIISLSAGDTINIRAYIDTNNSSSMTLKNGARNSVFSAFKVIE